MNILIAERRRLCLKLHKLWPKMFNDRSKVVPHYLEVHNRFVTIEILSLARIYFGSTVIDPSQLEPTEFSAKTSISNYFLFFHISKWSLFISTYYVLEHLWMYTRFRWLTHLPSINGFWWLCCSVSIKFRKIETGNA